MFHQAQNIAIIRRNGLGDLLCAMPLVSYCRKQAPNAEITLFVDRRNAPLTPYLKGFDEIHVFTRGNKYLAACLAGFKHRGKSFDIAIAAKPTPMKLMSFSLFALGAEKRIAVTDKGIVSRLVNSPQPMKPEGSRHQALAILQLVAPEIQELPRELYPKLHMPFAAKPNAIPVLFVSLTNNRQASSLGVEGHQRVLNALAKDVHFKTLISCESRDIAKAKALSAKLTMDHEVSPSYSIDQLLLQLQRSDAVFVGDGGVMHLAAALDKPQVVLFGRPIDTQWHPLSDKATWHVAHEHVLDICVDSVVEDLRTIFKNF
ncbi:MAG: glycosyltransferase family 9 protein [Chlamydiales bacterium]|nr:glycosyltransferase family 9 protein [Chlamydiales bacterium]